MSFQEGDIYCTANNVGLNFIVQVFLFLDQCLVTWLKGNLFQHQVKQMVVDYCRSTSDFTNSKI